MLLRFSAANFRSINAEQELSLIATTLKGLSEPLVYKREIDEAVLPVAAIYGSNASVKTNVVRAMHFLRGAISDSQRKWEPQGGIPRQPFMFGNAESKPSRFEADFLLRGVRYQYGFELDSKEVSEEWIYTYPTGKKQIWLERSGSTFSFGRSLTGENRAIQNLTRKNSLFLSAAAQNNHEMLLPIYDWFSTQVHFVRGARDRMDVGTARLCSDPAQKNAIERLLATADLGVTGVKIEEVDIDEEIRKVATGLRAVLPDVKLDIPSRTQRIFLNHQIASGESALLPLHEESNGTIAYFALLGPVVQALEKGGVLFVDELDTSLHPLLAIELVKMFNNPASNRKSAQLVFNTHDTNLLDQRILRRDQVWFTEKDEEGATHLYPLSDFTTRPQENIESGYLQGRYGAIPFLGANEYIREYLASREFSGTRG